MRATCIALTVDRATVVIWPGWLARLFGARAAVCELERAATGWVTAGTALPVTRERVYDGLNWISGDSRARLILDAIDFRPIAALPEARTVPR